jgi:hypothetical protein
MSIVLQAKVERSIAEFHHLRVHQSNKEYCKWQAHVVDRAAELEFQLLQHNRFEHLDREPSLQRMSIR